MYKAVYSPHRAMLELKTPFQWLVKENKKKKMQEIQIQIETVFKDLLFYFCTLTHAN